jgi:hypothetical protein
MEKDVQSNRTKQVQVDHWNDLISDAFTVLEMAPGTREGFSGQLQKIQLDESNYLL